MHTHKTHWIETKAHSRNEVIIFVFHTLFLYMNVIVRFGRLCARIFSMLHSHECLFVFHHLRLNWISSKRRQTKIGKKNQQQSHWMVNGKECLAAIATCIDYNTYTHTRTRNRNWISWNGCNGECEPYARGLVWSNSENICCTIAKRQEHCSPTWMKRKTPKTNKISKQTNTYYARCITKSIEKVHTMCIELRQVLPICMDFHTLRCTVCHRCRWNDDSKRACDCCVHASAGATVCACKQKYVHSIQKPAHIHIALHRFSY